MPHNKKWTKEDVLTLTTLRKKKVGFKYIAKVLERSEHSCRHKDWRLKNPDYWKDIEASKRKRKEEKKNSMVIHNLQLENESLNQLWEEAKQSVLDLHKQSENRLTRIKELEKLLSDLGRQNEERELRIQKLDEKLSNSYHQLKAAQDFVEAIQLNMNQYYNQA